MCAFGLLLCPFGIGTVTFHVRPHLLGFSLRALCVGAVAVGVRPHTLGVAALGFFFGTLALFFGLNALIEITEESGDFSTRSASNTVTGRFPRSFLSEIVMFQQKHSAGQLDRLEN